MGGTVLAAGIQRTLRVYAIEAEENVALVHFETKENLMKLLLNCCESRSLLTEAGALSIL